MCILCVCDTRFWLGKDIFARKMTNLPKNHEIQQNQIGAHNSYVIITLGHLDQWDFG